MILDYSEYVTEQDEKGFVNFFDVDTNSYFFNTIQYVGFAVRKLKIEYIISNL